MRVEDHSNARSKIRLLAAPVRSRDTGVSREKQASRCGGVNGAVFIRIECRLAERCSAPELVRIGKGGFPAKPNVEGEFLRDLDAVLRIDAHHPLAEIVRRRVGLLKVAHVAGHEISQAQTGERTIEGRYAVFIEAGDGVVQNSDDIKSETDLMLATDKIHIIGTLVAGDVEMAGGAGSAECGETASHAADEQKVWNSAVHVGTKVGPVDGGVGGSPIIADSVERGMHGIHRGGAKCIDIADSGRLRPFIVTRRSCRQQIAVLKNRRILPVVDKIAPK